MKITGIICEYNPLHLGHKKQLDTLRKLQGGDSGIVCLMSGNYVQRGAPAVFHKSYRAKAAVLCGADLVLELPVTAALSSAEGFAAGGVRALSPFCTHLCFGAETAEKETLMSTARMLLSPEFPEALRRELDKGLSFPSARQAALLAMGLDGSCLSLPNNILGVEYCKAILSQDSPMMPLPIHRGGNYHTATADPENPSATAIRELLLSQSDWKPYLPTHAAELFEGKTIHTLQTGERAVLAKLRSMTDDQFEALPYGSEGLWRKFMHACRKESTLEDILTATKSKRYTRTRLDRMMMCAFLGITAEDIAAPAPYIRVLGFNDRGRQILKVARETGLFPHTGERVDHPYQALEDRCGDLYGLFACSAPEAPGEESRQRVFIKDSAE